MSKYRGNDYGQSGLPWIEGLDDALDTAPSTATTAYGGTTGKAMVPVLPRCHESHPVLALGNGFVRGGSCHNPLSGYDVYVGLDYYMDDARFPYPWEPVSKKQKAVYVHFKIPDMGVPKDVKNFKGMITWLCNQLQEGKSVHIGCIGGHGRTGMVLSALVNQMNGTVDSTTWVRKHYCKKAVESSTQVEFLHKHYGIKKVKPAKIYTSYSKYGKSSAGTGYYPSTGYDYTPNGGGTAYVPSKSLAADPRLRKIQPVPSDKSIWGREKA